jgi:hypothetical protein
MLVVFKRIKKESVCLGSVENFQIWRAVVTYDQPKMSVIRGYVWFLLLKFFKFHHEFLIEFVK